MEREDLGDDRVQAAAEEMESGLEDLEERRQDVDEDIEDTRADWRSKQEDSSVPGAEPADEDQAP